MSWTIIGLNNGQWANLNVFLLQINRLLKILFEVASSKTPLKTKKKSGKVDWFRDFFFLSLWFRLQRCKKTDIRLFLTQIGNTLEWCITGDYKFTTPHTHSSTNITKFKTLTQKNCKQTKRST